MSELEIDRPSAGDIDSSPRTVAVYLSHLEGWMAATKETLNNRVPPHPKSRAKTEFTRMCGTCKYSRRIVSPEKSDIKFLVVCDEPTYGKGEMLVSQCRQLGLCGTEAKLREEG